MPHSENNFVRCQAQQQSPNSDWTLRALKCREPAWETQEVDDEEDSELLQGSFSAELSDGVRSGEDPTEDWTNVETLESHLKHIV